MFDVVLYGATGFTGQLAARYLAGVKQRLLPTLRFALAGRSRSKLEALNAGLGAAGCRADGVLIASADDGASIDAMAGAARVVISTAGPFMLHSDAVVSACVRLGADYVDITGETPWVRSLIDRHDAAARAKGVRIVPMCGFDSMPSDLGAFAAARALAQRPAAGTAAAGGGGGGARRVRRVVNYASMKGQLSGGTLATGMLMEERGMLGQIDDPFLLGGGRPCGGDGGGSDGSAGSDGGGGGGGGGGGVRAEDEDYAGVEWDEARGRWVAPFMMANLNTRVVRRSCALFGDGRGEAALQAGGGVGYGAEFNYQEKALFEHEKHARRAAAPVPDVPTRRALVEGGVLPAPGQGPDAATRAKSSFSMRFEALAEDGATCALTVSGGDPGYDETAKMVCEAGLCLALQRDALPPAGGVLTPATAMGSLLVERLQAAGIRFDFHDEGGDCGGTRGSKL